MNISYQELGLCIWYCEQAMGWMIWGLNPGSENRFFLSPKWPEWLCSSPSLLFNGYLSYFPGVKWLGHEDDHSWLSNAKVKNERNGKAIYLYSYRIWYSEDCASWHILIIKANKLHYFSNLLDKSTLHVLDRSSRCQQNDHDKYLLHIYSDEILLMMDSGPVRNM